MEPIELLQHDEDVALLLSQGLPDLILEMVGFCGSATALFALIFFTVWGIFQAVRTFKNIIS